MAGRVVMLSSSSSNCSIQSRQIRNHIYYQENKENLKNNKLRFGFNIEVKSDENDRLNAIKTKIAFVKQQLQLGATAVKLKIQVRSLLINQSDTRIWDL